MPNLRGPHRVRSGQALSPIPAVGCSPAFSFAYILDHMASTSPTESHEVYPNAPLALVAAEIRFPESTTDRTLPMTLLRIFRDALGDEWVIETRKMQQASVTIGPAGMVPQALTSVSVPRFTVRDRTLAVALTEDSMTIETTRYHHYPTFRSVLAKAAAAAAEVLTPDGVARIGLRYIDEIRVPGFLQEGLAEWHEWLNASLLAPDLLGMAEEGYKSAGWEGLVQYETGPNQKLVLRYGARSGYVVNPTGPLRRPHPPASGPLFFLDFDCFWEPEDIPEFDVDAVMTTWDRLRTPIRTLFDHLITDKLRAQFRKEAARA